MLSPSWRQVTHALLTRPPLSISSFDPKISAKDFSLDLHVLGTPPAFVLSQDQTLVDFVIYSWLPPCYILHQLNSLSLFSITSFLKFALTFWNWQGLFLPCAIVVMWCFHIFITASSLFTSQTSFTWLSLLLNSLSGFFCHFQKLVFPEATWLLYYFSTSFVNLFSYLISYKYFPFFSFPFGYFFYPPFLLLSLFYSL